LPALRTAGHEPIAMTRSPDKAATLRAQGIEAVVCDAYDADGLTRAVADARPDQIVHALTDLPEEINMRRFERDVQSTGRLRREGTRNLLAAARAAGVRGIVAESIAFIYAPEGDRVKDEDAPLAIATLPSAAEPIADLERQVLEAGGIVLRYGQLYGPGTGFAKDGAWAANLRRRRLPIVGAGSGVFSFLHVDDAASATVAALGREGPATYNVVDDDPAPIHEWAPVYARAVDAPKPWHAPAWVGRLAAGRIAVEMMQELRGASNARIKRELGWEPTYASWREGFQTALG
jgi:nucleoside-diphosphate-sugar epimerase